MEHYIQVEADVKIFVQDLNPLGKKTILFLHGWPLSHKAFEYQLNHLPKYGYRCIGIDMRGFGYSDKPYTGYDYNRLADDIRCVIDTLNLTDITLVGHSTGGAITIRYMSRHHGLGVSKLILLAAAAPSLIQRPYFPYGLKRDTICDIIKNTYQDRPNMIKDFGKLLFYKEVSKPLSDWIFQLGLGAASWSTAAVANTWISDEQLFYDLGTINVPTLIFHGIHDQVCLFPLAIAQIQLIKNAKLVPFEQSGHGLFYEEWEKVNQEIIKLVK